MSLPGLVACVVLSDEYFKACRAIEFLDFRHFLTVAS